jgi:aminoglycoside N3'-acetyltransferase
MSEAAPTELSKAEITSRLRAMGVDRAGVLLVHTSFRALRPVEGGPLGVIEAIRDVLGPTGTLAMPSFSGSDDEPFDPATSPASPDLGVVADTFWRLPGVLRSNHCHAFAAIGPYAPMIIADPLPLPPHIPESPAGRVHALGGQVLLLGVGHDADTMLHLAELIAGVPYGMKKHCTVMQDGRPVRIDYEENDHCCERFSLADTWLRERGLQSEGRIGPAYVRLARARDIVEVAVEHLKRDPEAFLHPPSAGCAECDEARRSLLLPLLNKLDLVS